MKTILALSIGLSLILTGCATAHKELPDTPFETRAYDKNGHLEQWYQHFLDSDGKEIIQIVRQNGGTYDPVYDPPPHEGIQYIDAYFYNADSNVTDEYEFFGDGRLRHHTIYRYDKNGNYIRGDMYDATGKLFAEETSEPEYHMYGKKRQKY